MGVLAGLFIAGIGVALIGFSAPLAKIMGRWERAESHIGGTRQACMGLGFIFIVLGVMIMFGAQFVKPDPTGLRIN